MTAANVVNITKISPTQRAELLKAVLYLETDGGRGLCVQKFNISSAIHSDSKIIV